MRKAYLHIFSLSIFSVMAFKAMLILCASLLLITTRVSSYDEHEQVEKKLDQSERRSVFSMPLYRRIPPEPSPAPLNQPVTPLPTGSPSPVTCTQATPPVSRQYYQSLFSMSLYPNIHDEPEPSSSPLSQTITTPPGSPLPVTCARATPPAKSTPPTPIVKTSRDCVPLCGARCKVETNKKIWRRMCMKCCDLCKCVPPGHCGTNMDKCGKCYIDMEDHGHKCP